VVNLKVLKVKDIGLIQKEMVGIYYQQVRHRFYVELFDFMDKRVAG